MKTIAEDIYRLTAHPEINADHIEKVIEKNWVQKSQNWQTGSTTYIFEDESAIELTGSELEVVTAKFDADNEKR